MCVPVASVCGTVLVNLFTGNQLAMSLVPCALGAVVILLFASTLDDRRLVAEDRPPWSRREVTDTLYVAPRATPTSPGFRQPLRQVFEAVISSDR